MKSEVDDLSTEARTVLEKGRAWEAINPAFGDEACERVLARVEANLAHHAPAPDVPPSRVRMALGLAALAALMFGAAFLARRPHSSSSSDTPLAAPQETADAEPKPRPPPGPMLAPSESMVLTVDVDALPTAKTSPATASTAAAAEEGTLGAELHLTSAARTALARGDTAGALRLVSEHERRFPAGELAQERESLRIQALAMSGRLAEARDRARVFRQRYPAGLLVPSVERALSSPDE